MTFEIKDNKGRDGFTALETTPSQVARQLRQLCHFHPVTVSTEKSVLEPGLSGLGLGAELPPGLRAANAKDYLENQKKLAHDIQTLVLQPIGYQSFKTLLNEVQAKELSVLRDAYQQAKQQVIDLTLRDENSDEARAVLKQTQTALLEFCQLPLVMERYLTGLAKGTLLLGMQGALLYAQHQQLNLAIWRLKTNSKETVDCLHHSQSVSAAAPTYHLLDNGDGYYCLLHYVVTPPAITMRPVVSLRPE